MLTRNKIEKWLEAKAQLNYCKAEEAKLREQIVEEVAGDKPPGKYTENKLGFKIKATKKINYSLDEQALSAIYESLSPAEKEAITYKPRLSLAKYKKAADHHMLDQVIIAKPAMPTLTIEEENGH